MLNEGKEADVPVPMKYMCRYRWQRELRPSHHTTVLTALLHCRMREGYHIAGAYNGVITLVVPLKVQVTHTACSVDKQPLCVTQLISLSLPLSLSLPPPLSPPSLPPSLSPSLLSPSLQQCSSDTSAPSPLALLQYVVFPADTSGVISCELWVEPQCGTITDTSPGLSYLNNLTMTEIANKVCA